MAGGDRVAAIRSRLEAVARTQLVQRLTAVLDRYDRAGGGLLAGGLAFGALFAIVPAILLVFGVTGLIVTDDERRTALIRGIAAYVPPLRDLIATSLASMARSGIETSAIGLLGFVWGTSRFVVALDDAFGRIFREAPKRGLVGQTIRGLVAVALLVVAFIAALGLSSAASLVADSLQGEITGSGPVWRIVSFAGSAVVSSVAVAILYATMPNRRLAWRAIIPPAAGVGVAIALLTQLFTYIAPRLIGASALLGGVAAVFVALAWLSLVFQAVLLGAAWLCESSGCGQPDGDDGPGRREPGQP